MLKLIDVSIHYGKVQALFNVNLQVNQGSIVALLGTNGAGKSTIMKAISGIVKPSKGSIEFLGEPIHTQDSSVIVRKGIVLCPEGRQVFPELTVYENLRIGSYVCKDASNVKTEMEKVLNYFPALKERLNQSAGTLSGGEQQMLAIGRALISKPKLLMLDEPSLGLAPMIVKEIFKIIKKINNEGTTILLVEQNVQMSMKIASMAYILELGKVALSGTPSELQSNDNIRKLYLGANIDS